MTDPAAEALKSALSYGIAAFAGKVADGADPVVAQAFATACAAGFLEGWLESYAEGVEAARQEERARFEVFCRSIAPQELAAQRWLIAAHLGLPLDDAPVTAASDFLQ